MTAPMWMKGDTQLDPAMMRFMAAGDVALDHELFPFDIRATGAHVEGLARIGLMAPADAQRVRGCLESLLAEFNDGRFALDDRFEDGHSAIEWRLCEQLGDLGKRVHLGRSRNDQVLVATRLYMLDALGRIKSLALDAARSSLSMARRFERTPMPGYTHLQRAVPSTVGLWMASFAESFTDDAALIGSTAAWMDTCPLGGAAGFGVNLPLPRSVVARSLGFERLQINPMYAQASRGKFEVQALAAVWQLMQDLRRLGWDLTLFASAEFGFVSLAAGATTGSSIMPNKRNPDVAELLRGSACAVAGAMAELQQIISLPSGYHRDLQLTKAPLIRGLRAAIRAGVVVPQLLEGLTIHKERMAGAIEPAMFATDRAVELAAAGVPFRDAYRTVGQELGELTSTDATASIEARVSPGACADLCLEAIEARITQAIAEPKHLGRQS